ncbi:MAG: glycoside hydrolase family 1 protein [Spirochaetes bacterium]|nr:glycoside hydrolase family 1 protein [Spirochaetota bacterium]
MAQKEYAFPKGFLWGTATAAHQIEGGNRNNNWWEFEQRPGAIRNGDSSAKACDHWNLYKKDFAWLTKLHQNAYRMSVEWSRLYPEPGRLDRKALDRYVAMIDELRKRKITPFVTLLHFTVPTWWDRQGGLLNRRREHLAHFEEFCTTVAEAFRGKGVYWNTINEISIVMLGYLTDEFPPAEKSFLKAARAVNTLLALHETAYRSVKRALPDSKIGLVHNMQMVQPLDPRSLSDRALARAVDFLFNGSIFRGLKTGRLIHGKRLPGLRGSTDFFGLNFYNFMQVSRSLPDMVRTATPDPTCGEEKLCAGIGWEPYPEGLYLALKRVAAEFPGMPVYVTENGIGTDDDAWRRRYLVDHLKMAHRAVEDGVDLRGFFHWSLMDNFEWAQGYMSRFGLINMDYRTQKRTLRESGRLYGEISLRNAIPPAALKKFPGDIYRPRF